MDTEQIASLFRRLDTGSLLDLVLILAGAVALIVTLQTALPWLANRFHGRARHILLAMVPLLRLVVFIGAFLLAVPIVIEPSVQNMVAVLGSLGLALGFALKDYASSLVAGVIAVGEAPYRNGDWVQIGATYGEVTRVGMRSVNLVTADDNLVSIPHSKLWTDPISNANNGGPQLQCTARFYLHPSHDGARVRELLFDVALTSAYLALDKPIVVVAEEMPWGTCYRLRAYPIEARQQFRFTTDLTLRGKAELLRQGFAMATASTRAERNVDTAA